MMNKFFRMMAVCALAGVPLLYTGCTDYSEDIDAVNSRIDALESGRIADVETQIGTLRTTLSSLEDAKSKTEAAITELKGQLATLDGKVDDLEGKVDGLDVDVSSLKSKVSSLESSLGTINSQIGTINGQISSLESSVEANGKSIKANADAIKENADSIKSILTQIGALSGRLGTVEDDLGSLKGKYDSDLKISEVLKKIEDAQAAADTAEVHATKALGEIKSLKEALGVYAETGRLQEALDAKLDTADFNKTFDRQLSLALAEDGKITTAIADAITAATNEIQSQINALKGYVKDLASRIQSLVFVPEYNDNKASSAIYTLGSQAIVKEQTVKATFKVTPVDLAAQIAAQKEGVFVYAVPVKTRAAAAEDVAGKITKLNAVGNGRLEVEAVFPTEGYKNFAIALYVTDEEVAEAVEEGGLEAIEEIDTKNYVSSEYVQVNVDEVALDKRYVLYNGTQTYKNTDYKAEWNKFPDTYDFHGKDKYYVALNLGTDNAPDYKTLAEAAEIINIDEEKITPAYEGTYKQFNGSTEEKPASTCKYINVVESKEAEGMVASIIGDVTPSTAKNFVGHKAVIDGTWSFTVNRQQIKVIESKDTYEIVNRQVAIKIESVTLPWNYATAVALADQQTTPWTPNAQALDKDFVQPNTNGSKPFKELYVTITGEENVELNLEEIVTGVTPTRKVNGSVATSPVLDVDAVAIIKSKIATVSVTGYEFEQGKDNVYSFENVYGHSASCTDVSVKFDLTLGQMPEVDPIDLGTKTVKFAPKVTKEPLADAIDQAFAKVSGYFEDKDAFIGSLPATAERTESYRTSDKPSETKLSGVWTYLQVLPGNDNAFIRLSTNNGLDVQSFDDTFRFETEYKTWYGVNYTYKAAVEIEDATVSLELDDLTVNSDHIVPLDGEKVNDKYEIKRADLANYFMVANLSDVDDADLLEVTYEVLTKSTVDGGEQGYYNIPVPTATAVAVTSGGRPGASTIDWGTYTARDLTIKATLTYGGLKVNEQTVTLTIKDPVAGFSAPEIKVEREANKPVSANLWSTMELYGILTPETNLIDQAAASASSIIRYNADNVYGLSVTFSDEFKVVKVDKGGDFDEGEVVTNLAVSVANGVVSYTPSGESASELLKDIIVECEVTVRHNYDYDGENPDKESEGNPDKGHGTTKIYVRIVQK